MTRSLHINFKYYSDLPSNDWTRSCLPRGDKSKEERRNQGVSEDVAFSLPSYFIISRGLQDALHPAHLVQTHFRCSLTVE